MHEDRKQRLAEYVAWVAKHIKGDEKGEAQIFLDRLFAAFGRKGVKEAGTTLEQRIKKADNRGTAFADLVWKPVVLIEMKRRGEDLMRHYRQAFDYWTRLVPGRPRYVVLCNFDEFWVYDFETQMDTPVDRLALAELPDRWGPLAFLFPTDEKPIFGNDHEAVTRKAADCLAVCFNKLISRKVDRLVAQRFVLQMLVALFAEDIGLLDQYTLTRLLEECQKPSDAYDLLGGLFLAMNTPGVTAGGRFKGVQYFNGGLFAEPAQIELWPDEVAQLRQAARADWSQVRPEIFGVLFEHSMEKGARHAFGAHFTSPVDIMKIVGPTIVEPWREQIENATTMARLNRLLNRMHEFTVLDPACGSGNFLYIAYRELKRLEARIIERLNELSKKLAAEQQVMGFVTAANFYGMDINPFAIELAKVTMMIARKLAIDELHISEHALPLDNLDANFFACDALIDQQGNPTPWPKVQRDHRQSAVFGNETAQARAPRRLRQGHPQCLSGSAGHGRLLRLLVPPRARPAQAVYGGGSAHGPGGIGRHAERPQQPVPRGRAGSYRSGWHDRRGRGEPTMVGRGQRARVDRQLGQVAGCRRSSGEEAFVAKGCPVAFRT